MTEAARAPVSDPTRPVQASSGIVAAPVEQPIDGVLDPTFWEGLDATSQGPVAEALPQPPQNEADYEWQMGNNPDANPDAPEISGLTVGDITATTATVTWTTSEPATTRVRGGLAPNDFTHASPIDETYVTDHSATLEGLPSGTHLYVEVDSRDPDGNMFGAQTEFDTLAE